MVAVPLRDSDRFLGKNRRERERESGRRESVKGFIEGLVEEEEEEASRDRDFLSHGPAIKEGTSRDSDLGEVKHLSRRNVDEARGETLRKRDSSLGRPFRSGLVRSKTESGIKG